MTTSYSSQPPLSAILLGADAVTPDAICESDLVQARLKEKMASRAQRVFVLIDSSMINQHPFHAGPKLREGWTPITDTQASTGQLAPFKKANVEIMSRANTHKGLHWRPTPGNQKDR